MNLRQISVSCVSLVLVACGDASQLFSDDGEGGAGGSTTSTTSGHTTGPTGSGGNQNPDQCGGAACTEATPDCSENGTVFTCLCGVMLPKGADVTCGSGGGGGNGGNGGGGSTSTTTSTGSGTTTTGSGGEGGGDGGNGGTGTTSSSTSASSSSSTSSSTSSSSSSSSTGSGGGTVTSQLKVTLVPVTGGNHAIAVYCYIDDGQSPSKLYAVNGTRIVITESVPQGIDFVCSGVYDPPNADPNSGAFWTNQFCDPTNFSHRLAAMWGTFDNDTSDAVAAKFTEVITSETNGQGGCQLRVTAAPSSLISANDADGDGVPANLDCNDNDGSIFPGQVETPDDGNLSVDCDPNPNPAKAIVWLKTAPGGASPTLHDVTHNTTQSMSWTNGNGGGYVTPAMEMKNSPKEFYITWPDVGGWPLCYAGTCYSTKDYNGCTMQPNSVFMTKDTDNTQITITQQASSPCHQLANGAQMNP